MWIAASGAQRRIVIALSCALTALAAAVIAAGGEAHGTTVTAELRIEGPKGNIDPGTFYETGTEKVKRSRGLDCKHRNGKIEVEGPTALGIASTASDERKDLPALRVRPDDFGLFVCELGGLIGRPFDDPDGFSGWTYWVDYTGGTQAAELETLSEGEHVLWAFSDYGERNLNTGNALELSGVPPYDADGSFDVHVVSHTFDGTPSDFNDATIKGADTSTSAGSGDYHVTVSGQGLKTLWAKHKPDIASNRMRVCVEPSIDDCP